MRISARHLVSVLGLALLVPSVSAAATATADQRTRHENDDGGPHIVSGTVLTESGQPAAGATVSVSAMPLRIPASGMVFPREIASTSTDAHGAFSLHGALSDERLFADGRGDVTLELSALVDRSMVHATLTSRYQPHSDEGWVSAASDSSGRALDGVTLQVGRGPVADDAGDAGTAGTRTTPLEPGPAGPDSGVPRGLALPTTTSPPDGWTMMPRAQRSADLPSCASYETPFWLITHKTERTNPALQRLTSGLNSRQTYTWETTKETELEVGYFGDGDYAGGLMKSRSATTVGHEWGVKRASKVFRVGWQYMQFKGGCANSRGQIRYTGEYKGEPWKQTGGSSYQSNRPTWSCQRRNSDTMAARTWFVRESSVAWNGWFKIGGLSLGALQTNTSSHKVVVDRVKGRPAPRICGDNDFPVYADRLQEVRR